MNTRAALPPVDLVREEDFALGILQIRPSGRRVSARDHSEILEPRVMQLLVALARAPGEVVSRDDLIQSCWAGRVVGEDALNRCVAKVRKLGETTRAFRLETIPRVGYELIVTARPDSPLPAVARENAPEHAAPPPSGVRKRRWVLPLAAATLLLGMAIAALFWLRASDGPGPRGPSTVAVLPFDVLGADAVASSVAKATASSIADALARSGETVLAPSRSATYTGTRKTLAVKELGAHYLFDGDVKLLPGRVLLTVRLIDASSVVVWSRLLEAPPRSAVDLPERAGYLAAIALRSLGDDALSPASHTAAGLRVFQSHFDKRYLASYEEARRMAAANPRNDSLMVAEVLAGVNALREIPVGARADTLAHWRRQLARAATVLPRDPRYFIADGRLRPESDHAGRQAAFKQGLSDDVGGDASAYFGMHLMVMGRLDEALMFAEQAATRHPKPYSFGPLMVRDAQGKYSTVSSEADALYRLSPEFHARFYFALLLGTGRTRDAATMLDDPKLFDIVDPPAEVRPMRLMISALEDRAPANVRRLEDACRDATRLSVTGRIMCLESLSRLGRIDAAFELADQMYPDLRGATAGEREARWLANPGIFQSYVTSLFRAMTVSMRADPRFIPLVERLGLLDHWRSGGDWPDFCRTEPGSVCARMRAM